MIETVSNRNCGGNFDSLRPLLGQSPRCGTPRYILSVLNFEQLEIFMRWAGRVMSASPNC